MLPRTDEEYARQIEREGAQRDRVQLEEAHSKVGVEASIAAILGVVIASQVESILNLDSFSAGWIGIFGAGLIFQLIGLDRRSELKARWSENDRRVAELSGQSYIPWGE